MFEKIVLAADLSPAWDEIIACAGEFRLLGCSQVILTHVITVKSMTGLESSLLADAQPKLQAQKEQLESLGLDVVVETPLGLPAFSINETAERHCASMIVVGSHGKALWREAVLGSVSSAILHNARFPVLLLNVKLLKGEGRGTCQLRTGELLRHVLLPTDFSKTADRASDFLFSLIPKGLSQATLLHALEVSEASPPAFLEWSESAAGKCLGSLETRLRMAGLRQVNTLLSHGHPVAVILEAVRSQDYSLIVMGTQGKSMLTEILLGSVAHNISRQAPCPVLLVPRAGL